MKADGQMLQDLLEQLCCNTCKGEYCFLKKFLTSMNPDPFMLVQLKCIEKYKWEESEREGTDIGWNEAGQRWAVKGFAVRFREVYVPTLSVEEVYDKIVRS